MPPNTTALSTTELSISASTGLISLMTSDNTKVGSHSVTVIVKLVSYPAVALSVTFTAIIQPCVIISLDTSQTTPISNKLYHLGDNTMTWSFLASNLVTQVPACGYQVDASSSFMSTSYL